MSDANIRDKALFAVEGTIRPIKDWETGETVDYVVFKNDDRPNLREVVPCCKCKYYNAVNESCILRTNDLFSDSPNWQYVNADDWCSYGIAGDYVFSGISDFDAKIIQCRDCKYYNWVNESCIYKTKDLFSDSPDWWYVDPEDYCSCGIKGDYVFSGISDFDAKIGGTD